MTTLEIFFCGAFVLAFAAYVNEFITNSHLRKLLEGYKDLNSKQEEFIKTQKEDIEHLLKA